MRIAKGAESLRFHSDLQNIFEAISPFVLFELSPN